jgi:Tfp pilus assembly protein PilF
MIKMLEQQIVEGNSIALAHFALGAAKWMDGDQGAALWHTERALQLQPNLTDVANNFAWLLAQGESPDLSRALVMIDAALQKQPGDYRYLDTRGTILMKLQRWEDALTDFESILPRVPARDRAGVHQNLAEIYSRLGRTELADRHRSEAGKTARPPG